VYDELPEGWYSKEQLRTQLRAFYQQVNPEKLLERASIFDKGDGNAILDKLLDQSSVEELAHELYRVYGEVPEGWIGALNTNMAEGSGEVSAAGGGGGAGVEPGSPLPHDDALAGFGGGMQASSDTPECKLSRGCRAQLQLQQEGQVLFDSHDKGSDVFNKRPARKTITDKAARASKAASTGSVGLLQTGSRARADTADVLAEESECVEGGDDDDDEAEGAATSELGGLVARVETEMAAKACASAAETATSAAAAAVASSESVEELAGVEVQEVQQSCFLDVEGEGGGRTYIDDELDEIFGDEDPAGVGDGGEAQRKDDDEEADDGDEDDEDDDWMTCEDPTGTLTESKNGGYNGYDEDDEDDEDEDLLGVYCSGGGGGTGGGGDDWVGSEGGGMSFKVDCVVYGDVVLAIRHLTHELSVNRLLKSAAAEQPGGLGPVHTAETMFKASFHTGEMEKISWENRRVAFTLLSSSCTGGVAILQCSTFLFLCRLRRGRQCEWHGHAATAPWAD
jgi:hypothetical protein